MRPKHALTLQALPCQAHPLGNPGFCGVATGDPIRDCGVCTPPCRGVPGQAYALRLFSTEGEEHHDSSLQGSFTIAVCLSYLPPRCGNPCFTQASVGHITTIARLLHKWHPVVLAWHVLLWRTSNSGRCLHPQRAIVQSAPLAPHSAHAKVSDRDLWCLTRCLPK